MIIDHPVFFSASRLYLVFNQPVFTLQSHSEIRIPRFTVPAETLHHFNQSVSVTDSLDQLNADNSELILEQVVTPQRKTAFIYLQQGEILPQHSSGIEILILEGTGIYNNQPVIQGHYLRIPGSSQLSAGSNGCKLFVKYHQFMQGDSGERTIDTSTEDKWLPGPTDGIKIRPLHVFNTESIMLLYWQHADEFRPNLDPQGEEIVVIKGLLQNRDHLFKPYSWIRNPVEDWRSWHGSTGTLAYYKSGHFPEFQSSTSTPDR